MELQVVKPRRNTQEITLDVPEIIASSGGATSSRKHFIEANTNEVSIAHLKQACTIPVFSKDNECTIAHQEFIDVVQESAMRHFAGHSISTPDIRVSHVVKGRIPEAIGKPAKDLLDHEKTIYYERMAFIMEIPGIYDHVNGNDLTLTIGGVRAYNHENLYTKKTMEKFKVFIGFKNLVCTNLCISTDGFANELRVSHLGDLQEKVLALFQKYDAIEHIKEMKELSNYHLTEHQFAQLIGKMRLYAYIHAVQKRALPILEFNDGQMTAIARDYYQDQSFCRNEDGNIDLWKCYNLFTGSCKSNYIDSFLNRTVNAYTFNKGLVKALKGDHHYSWFLN